MTSINFCYFGTSRGKFLDKQYHPKISTNARIRTFRSGDRRAWHSAVLSARKFKGGLFYHQCRTKRATIGQTLSRDAINFCDFSISAFTGRPHAIPPDCRITQNWWVFLRSADCSTDKKVSGKVKSRSSYLTRTIPIKFFFESCGTLALVWTICIDTFGTTSARYIKDETLIDFWKGGCKTLYLFYILSEKNDYLAFC